MSLSLRNPNFKGPRIFHNTLECTKNSEKKTSFNKHYTEDYCELKSYNRHNRRKTKSALKLFTITGSVPNNKDMVSYFDCLELEDEIDSIQD